MNGSDLRAWRDRHKLSLRQAEKALGYSRATLAKYEERSDALPRHVGLACAAYSYGLKPMGDDE